MDKKTGIPSQEIFNHLNLMTVTVREDRFYQGDLLAHGNDINVQPFPGRKAMMQEDTVKPMDG